MANITGHGYKDPTRTSPAHMGLTPQGGRVYEEKADTTLGDTAEDLARLTQLGAAYNQSVENTQLTNSKSEIYTEFIAARRRALEEDPTTAVVTFEDWFKDARPRLTQNLAPNVRNKAGAYMDSLYADISDQVLVDSSKRQGDNEYFALLNRANLMYDEAVASIKSGDAQVGIQGLATLSDNLANLQEGFLDAVLTKFGSEAEALVAWRKVVGEKHQEILSLILAQDDPNYSADIDRILRDKTVILSNRTALVLAYDQRKSGWLRDDAEEALNTIGEMGQ